MGTNYYARIIPTRERKEKIKKAIDDNQFNQIQHLVYNTYGSLHYDYDEELKYVGGEVHLGKRSSGWKFLWNPNWYKLLKGHLEKTDNENGSISSRWVNDGYDVFKFYDLTKTSIKEFIDRKDIEIYDEYGDKQDKEEFWDMALNWGGSEYNKGWDGETYEEWEKTQNPNRTPRNYENDYSKFIKELGFKVNKYNTDFYSDGMRFATCTEFS